MSRRIQKSMFFIIYMIFNRGFTIYIDCYNMGISVQIVRLHRLTYHKHSQKGMCLGNVQ